MRSAQKHKPSASLPRRSQHTRPCTVQALEPCRWRESSCLSFGTAHPSAAVTEQGQRILSAMRTSDTPQAEDALYRRRGHRRENAGVYDRYGSRSAAQSQRAGWTTTRILADFGGTVLAGVSEQIRRSIRHMGLGLRPHRCVYTGTTSWRTTMPPSRTSPHAPGLSKRNSFSARSS